MPTHLGEGVGAYRAARKRLCSTTHKRSKRIMSRRRGDAAPSARRWCSNNGGWSRPLIAERVRARAIAVY